jgi:hypothetical protein
VHSAGQHSFDNGTVVVLIFLCTLFGVIARKLWQHVDDVRSLKRRLNGARRLRNTAIVLVGAVGFWLLALAWHWVVTVNKG